MTSVLMKRGNLETDMHIGGTPCEDEDKDWAVIVQILKCQNHRKQTTRSYVKGMDRILAHSLKTTLTLMILV